MVSQPTTQKTSTRGGISSVHHTIRFCPYLSIQRREHSMENVKSVLDQIRKASDMASLSQVTMVHGYLETVGKVEIQIHDRGEDDDLRYSIHARTLDLEKPKTANSNAEADLETAIATTHWYQLSS